MLTAAISGDIFASPSAAQICSGLDLANTDKGVVFIVSGQRRAGSVYAGVHDQSLITLTSRIISPSSQSCIPPTIATSARYLCPCPTTSTHAQINNYTGDQLHFGLAAEKARAALAISGNKTSGGVESVTVADDVAVGRAKGGLVGRRGLGMNPFSCKVLGAASERGLSVKEIKSLGDTLIANSVTIGTSLDHCHVPGRPKKKEEWGGLPDDACEIGMGIHNEPGFRRLDQTPAPEKLIAEMLKYMLDPNDDDRHFIDFEKDDAPVIFINNLGGVSQLELFALVDETVEQLDKTYGLHPARVYANAYMTSLNAPGFGITLVKHKAVTRETKVDLLELLDAPTDAYAWTGVKSGWGQPTGQPRDRDAEAKEASDRLAARRAQGGSVSGLDEDAKEKQEGPINADPEVIKKVLLSAAEAAIAAEPSMTRHDTIVGDGDAGETLAQVAKAVQAAVKKGEVDLNNAAGTCLTLGNVIESHMGGTSGAIYALYFAGLVQGLVGGPGKPGQPAGEKEWSHAAKAALENLKTYTPAREGHRTLMDSLIPACEALGSGRSLSDATKEAEKGCEGTKKLVPRLGRATYQGSDNTEMFQVPDPGAEGVVAIFQGILKALQ